MLIDALNHCNGIRPLRYSLAAVGLVATLTACDKREEPPPPRQPAAPTGAQQSATALQNSTRPEGSKLAWDAPTSFKRSDEKHPMRIATYKFARASGDAEDAELAVSQAGGSVDANIKRWAGQFEGQSAEHAKLSGRKVNGLDITVVEMRGTYHAMSMPNAPPPMPREKYAMLAAIVPVGNAAYFFKLTGPEATVTAARQDFDTLVGSIRPEASP